MRSRPVSPPPPVPRTQAGLPPRDSAHWRIWAWLVVGWEPARPLPPLPPLPRLPPPPRDDEERLALEDDFAIPASGRCGVEIAGRASRAGYVSRVVRHDSVSGFRETTRLAELTGGGAAR